MLTHCTAFVNSCFEENGSFVFVMGKNILFRCFTSWCKFGYFEERKCVEAENFSH